MPMLELLGFTDSDKVAVITAPHVQPAIPVQDEPSTRPPDAIEPETPKPRLAPRLADVQSGQRTENTGVLVARLWEATSEDDPLADDWQPSETIEEPRRKFRWSQISTALVVTLIVTLLGIGAYRWPADQAEQLRSTLTSEVAMLDAASGRLPETVALLTDSAAPSSQLAGLTAPLLALSEAGNQAYETATADVTSGIPIISTAPLDALAPTKLSLQRAADETLVIHERIGNLLDYRILIERAFVLPVSLPVEATDGQISDLGVSLSDTLAETTEVLLQLPPDAILDSHRQLVEETFAQMNIDIADYLSALRSQNEFAASRISGNMRNSAASVFDAFDQTMKDYEVWLMGAISSLETQIDVTTAKLQTSGF